MAGDGAGWLSDSRSRIVVASYKTSGTGNEVSVIAGGFDPLVRDRQGWIRSGTT